MSPTVAEVAAVAETLWPAAGAESWDACGLVSGDPAASVGVIHLTVDAVLATVDEAVAAGADLLIAHHPLLLRGVTSIAEDRYKGVALARLVRAGCALFSAHTTADVVETGTSGTLASLLGLREVHPIVAASEPGRGLGRVGTLPEPTTVGRLARRLGELLPATAGGIRVAGDYDSPVSTVALCAGAGDSLLGEAAVRTADAYITSDLRHHPASEFRESGAVGHVPALLDVSHWASEWLWLQVAAQQLRDALPGVVVTVSDIRTDPWDFVVVQ